MLELAVSLHYFVEGGRTENYMCLQLFITALSVKIEWLLLFLKTG